MLLIAILRPDLGVVAAFDFLGVLAGEALSSLGTVSLDLVCKAGRKRVHTLRHLHQPHAEAFDSVDYDKLVRVHTVAYRQPT